MSALRSSHLEFILGDYLQYYEKRLSCLMLQFLCVDFRTIYVISVAGSNVPIEDQDDLSEEKESDSDAGGHEARGDSTASVTAPSSKRKHSTSLSG